MKKTFPNTGSLSELELTIMNVLWTSEKPLIASEIAAANEILTVPTVQRLLKKLLENDFIEIADIVTSGKVLARSYRAVKTQQDYMKIQLSSYYPDKSQEIDFSKVVVAALLNEAHNNEAVISELEKFLLQKKRELKESKNHYDKDITK